MKIEQAIKQSKFENAYHKVVVNLIYTATKIKEKQADIFKKNGLVIQHFNALRIIRGRYPNSISPGEIKEVMIEKANDLTRLLDKLVAMELICRNICPVNRRKMDIIITDKGQQLLKELEIPMKIALEQIKLHITEEEAEQLSNMLDKIRG